MFTFSDQSNIHKMRPNMKLTYSETAYSMAIWIDFYFIRGISKQI